MKNGRVEVGWKSDWITRRVDSYAGRLRYFLVTVLALLAGIIIFLIHMLVVRPVHDIDRRLKREVCADPASAGPRIRSMEFHRLSDSVDRFHKLLWQKEEATRELEEFVPLSMH